MSLYTCIQKNTDKYGNAISFILQDEAGRVGEFRREAVVALLQNRNNNFTNLKLTSDGKVILKNSENETNVKHSKALGAHPSAVLAMLIVQLCEENLRQFNNHFYSELNAACAYGNERQVLDKYLESIEMGLTHEAYLSLITRSKSIELKGVYTNNHGKKIGYKIKNIGNQPIQYMCGVYSTDGDHDENILVHTKEIKTIQPNETIAINKIDAIRLISEVGFGGMWSNTMLKCGNLPKGALSAEEFMRYCYLDSMGKPVVKDRDLRYIMLSMGEIRDINYEVITPAMDEYNRKNQGIKGKIKGWFK